MHSVSCIICPNTALFEFRICCRYFVIDVTGDYKILGLLTCTGRAILLQLIVLRSLVSAYLSGSNSDFYTRNALRLHLHLILPFLWYAREVASLTSLAYEERKNRGESVSLLGSSRISNASSKQAFGVLMRCSHLSSLTEPLSPLFLLTHISCTDSPGK